MYFAKNLLQFFELIEKSNDEKCFRVILKEKYNNLNAMKNKYMEVISELTFAKEENVIIIHIINGLYNIINFIKSLIKSLILLIT